MTKVDFHNYNQIYTNLFTRTLTVLQGYSSTFQQNISIQTILQVINTQTETLLKNSKQQEEKYETELKSINEKLEYYINKNK